MTVGVRYQRSTKAGIAAQAPQAPPVDVDELGPQVGEVVPDFSAPDQFGGTQTLKSIMGPTPCVSHFAARTRYSGLRA